MLVYNHQEQWKAPKEKRMLTQAQEESIKRNIKHMQEITKATNDVKERFYYYGQIDGILGLLDLLGINIDIENKE